MTIDDKFVQKLKLSGLSDKEALIYASLLESGGSYPSKISENTKLNRTTVYKILESMSIKGLVSDVEKEKKIFYQVESPKNLKRYIDSKITVIKREQEHLQTVLPKIEGLFATIPNKPIVRFYEGQEGVLSVYRDHVNVEEKFEMLAFSNTADLMQFLSDDFRNEYIRKKAKLNIKTRAILPDSKADLKYNETFYSKFPNNIWPKIKHIPKEKFPFKSDLTIYGKNKISIINFNDPQYAGTIIEDQIIHDLMVMIFELSWNGL